jgi:hypothetical protein
MLQINASYIKGVHKYYYGDLFYKYKFAKRNFLSTYTYNINTFGFVPNVEANQGVHNPLVRVL